jgi:hypothetical protein
MLLHPLFFMRVRLNPNVREKNPTPRHFSPSLCRPLNAAKITVNQLFRWVKNHLARI